MGKKHAKSITKMVCTNFCEACHLAKIHKKAFAITGNRNDGTDH